jgi:hypothetical protein
MRVLHGLMAALPPIREGHRRAYDRAGRRYRCTSTAGGIHHGRSGHTTARREVSVIWENFWMRCITIQRVAQPHPNCPLLGVA